MKGARCGRIVAEAMQPEVTPWFLPRRNSTILHTACTRCSFGKRLGLLYCFSWQRGLLPLNGSASRWTQRKSGKFRPNCPAPLQFYLTASPEHDPSNSLCLGCKIASGEAVSLNDFAIKTSKQLVGEAFGKAIYQIELLFEAKKGSVVEQMHHEWKKSIRRKVKTYRFKTFRRSSGNPS